MLKKIIARLIGKYTMYSIVMRLGEWAYEYSDYLDSTGQDGSKHGRMAKALFACANKIYNIWH